MKQTVKAKESVTPPFFISLGMCGGKPTLLNVNCIESIELDGDNYVFTMESGKVFRGTNSPVLGGWLKPFVIGHEVK